MARPPWQKKYGIRCESRFDVSLVILFSTGRESFGTPGSDEIALIKALRRGSALNDRIAEGAICAAKASITNSANASALRGADLAETKLSLYWRMHFKNCVHSPGESAPGLAADKAGKQLPITGKGVSNPVV
jgi:hypothetical protein